MLAGQKRTLPYIYLIALCQRALRCHPPQHVQDFHMGAALIVLARYMQAIACPNIAISRHFAVLQLQIF